MDIGLKTKNSDEAFGKDSFFNPENGGLLYLGEEEMKKLLAVLDEKLEGKGKRKSPEYLKNIIKVAILTGMRKTDLLNLKWSDYKRESGRLYFYEKKKRRMADKILSDGMIGLLESLPHGESKYIFTAPDGKALKSLQRSFRTALKRAGIKDFRFHDLWHTSASYLLMRGASLKTVQKQLGHTTLKMTEQYAQMPFLTKFLLLARGKGRRPLRRFTSSP
jgi:integrase